MHDRLFEHQRELDDIHLKIHSSDIRLDIPRFENEMSNHVHIDHVRQDVISGINSGLEGTHAFYINGRRYDDSLIRKHCWHTLNKRFLLLLIQMPILPVLVRRKMHAKPGKAIPKGIGTQSRVSLTANASSSSYLLDIRHATSVNR